MLKTDIIKSLKLYERTIYGHLLFDKYMSTSRIRESIASRGLHLSTDFIRGRCQAFLKAGLIEVHYMQHGKIARPYFRKLKIRNGE